MSATAIRAAHELTVAPPEAEEGGGHRGVGSNRAPAVTLTRLWIAGVFAFSAVKLVLAWGLLRRYHVNAYVFAALDFGTAYPYAWGCATVVRAALARRMERVGGAGLIVLASYVLPYGYLGLASRQMPVSVWVVLGVGLGCCAALTIKRLKGQIASG